MQTNIINFPFTSKDKVMRMCKILKKLNGKTAQELLDMYDIKNSIPVDLTKLANKIGISILPADFSDLEKKLGKKDILGLVLTDGDNAAIFYKKTDSINRIRFTVAHELAHCCNIDPAITIPHIEYRTDEDSKNEFEKKMDIFAGELLIPIDKLKKAYMSLPIPASSALAKKFMVSIKVMEARLNYLKVSHFNSKGRVVIYE